ncbi:MAG: GIY-YIG nuclease family protein [Flavobacteriales bacterium]|nr:GIY-YIG nuclease family protein [Flavobacteriales bacterium]
MENYNSKDWSDFLNSSLKELLQMKPMQFSLITPSVLPINAGVYLITETYGHTESALYVGRTKNLRQRLYTNHLMGSTSNARLKKYIIHDENHSCFGDVKKAKEYIREFCQVRWVFQDDTRVRGAIEGYFTAKFFPKYGIAEEH